MNRLGLQGLAADMPLIGGFYSLFLADLKQSIIQKTACRSFSVNSEISITDVGLVFKIPSTVVLNIRAISTICLSWGVAKPSSHEFTELRVTSSRFASSDWVIPAAVLSSVIL